MKLGICAIAYNEAEHIDFWYKHHKNLADEFVLVDTGSKDDTVKLAEKYPIKIFNYNWQHHFAETKNFAIQQSSCDWILFLSPDYWIDKKDFPQIRNALNNKILAYKLPFKHCVVDWFDTKHTKNGTDYHTVLFKNCKEIYYHGRVHETVDSSIMIHKIPCRILEIMRYHDSTQRKNNLIKEIYYKYLLTSGEQKINIPYANYLRELVYKEEAK